MMSTRHLAALLILAGAAGFVSRASADGDDKGVTLTDKDDGKKITLKKDESLVVKLEAVPTAGFVWLIVQNDKDKLMPQGKPETVPAKKGVIGGKATMIFRFQAVAGTSDLELHYKRPFEKDKKPAKTFKVTVEVK